MSEIELKRANVVKRVDSEDKAKALELFNTEYKLEGLEEWEKQWNN